jgi:hypothetical protein
MMIMSQDMVWGQFRMAIDTLALPLSNQRPLELGKRAHHREQQRRHRRVVARKGQPFFDNSDLNAAAGKLLDDLAEVVEIPHQPVQFGDHHSVPRPHQGKQCSKLRAFAVLPRGVIGEELEFNLWSETYTIKNAQKSRA